MQSKTEVLQPLSTLSQIMKLASRLDRSDDWRHLGFQIHSLLSAEVDGQFAIYETRNKQHILCSWFPHEGAFPHQVSYPMPGKFLPDEKIIELSDETTHFGIFWWFPSQHGSDGEPWLSLICNLLVLLLKQYHFSSSASPLAQKLLEQLFAGESAEAEMLAVLLGYNLGEEHRVIRLELSSSSPYFEYIHSFFKSYSPKALLSSPDERGLKQMFSCLLPNDSSLQQNIEDLFFELQGKNVPVFIGMSEPCNGIHSYSQALREAEIALQVAHLNSHTGAIVPHEEVGIYSLFSVAGSPFQNHPFQKEIESMAAHDNEKGTIYLLTLETFLDLGGNAAQTAQTLLGKKDSHTIDKRLLSLSKKFLRSIPIKNPTHWTPLQIAIKSYRLDQLKKRDS